MCPRLLEQGISSLWEPPIGPVPSQLRSRKQCIAADQPLGKRRALYERVGEHTFPLKRLFLGRVDIRSGKVTRDHLPKRVIVQSLQNAFSP